MVRLVVLTVAFWAMWNLFQFHYGTIGSHAELLKTLHQRLFQFHYGTIGRKLGVAGNGSSLDRFNSTMVRLVV